MKEWWNKESDEIKSISAQLDHLKRTEEREQSSLKKAESELNYSLDAQEILQHLAQAVQQQAHARISEVVSSCLSTVFDNPYEFKIEFERKRGKTEAHLKFVRNDIAIDPLTASGGGMIDVAAFALRVACLMLHRPQLSRIVILDEPFKFVSTEYRENVKSMLEQLSKDMDIQIIMVTHIEELETGMVVEL